MKVTNSLANSKLFQDAMAAFASGITAVTTRADGVPAGLIATAVCSLSADPASLIACVNKTASAHDVIVSAGYFAVNLLSSDQKNVAQRFSKEKGADRFDPALWTTLATGAPVLKEAVVAFDCEVLACHDGYTHTIIVGAIKEIALSSTPHASCLLWHQRDFARSALMGA